MFDSMFSLSCSVYIYTFMLVPALVLVRVFAYVGCSYNIDFYNYVLYTCIEQSINRSIHRNTYVLK